jgi:PAS domain S-box-containing protein
MTDTKTDKRLGVLEESRKTARESSLVKIVLDALHSSIGGVVISELDGTIKWANPAFLKMSGYGDQESLHGKKLTDLFASSNIRSMGDLARAIGEGGDDRAEMQMVDEDGELFFVEVAEQDVKSAEGEVIGRASSMIDVTLRKRIEAALKASRLRIQTLSSKLIDAQEAERKRVGRELHDSIGASLSALKFSVEQWFEQHKRPDGAACPPPDEIVANIQQIIEEVRRISQNLHPTILDDLGLVTAVRSFCRQHQETHPHMKIEADLPVDEQIVPGGLQLVIYRMVQECTTNALRHGEADTVQILLASEGQGEIFLEVRDNGIGFEVDETWDRLGAEGGIGLTSMNERAELTDGRLSIDSQIGKGTVIRCRWSLT